MQEGNLNRHEEFTFCVASLSSMTVSILEVDMVIVLIMVVFTIIGSTHT